MSNALGIDHRAASQYFEKQKAAESTHWADCWKTHPTCAYFLGIRTGIDEGRRAEQIATAGGAVHNG